MDCPDFFSFFLRRNYYDGIPVTWQETPNSEIWESALVNLSLMATAKSEV